MVATDDGSEPALSRMGPTCKIALCARTVGAGSKRSTAGRGGVAGRNQGLHALTRSTHKPPARPPLGWATGLRRGRASRARLVS